MLTPKKSLFTRRRFLQSSTASLLTLATTYAYGRRIEVRNLQLEHIHLPLTGLSANWHNKKIVQLSDLHATNVSPALILHAFQIARDLQPDFLVITGDWLTNSLRGLSNINAALDAYNHVSPILGILGNHDYDGRSLADDLTAHLQSRGVIMLRNDIHQPLPGPGQLCFIGVEDLRCGILDPTAIATAPADSTRILLSHNPDSVELCSTEQWPVMLSGHTHGGQVRIPGYGAIILPVRHKERQAGLYHLPNDRRLYVNRGVGHMLKIRLFCPPEVTCFTLQCV